MDITFPNSVRCYLVGGAVRDQMMGIQCKDKDYMLTGATPEMLTDLGFQQVGRDFPVFLHPDSKQEYALARTEKKSGHGYTGFVTDFHPNVTVEEDLARRDLTINAMAKDETSGQLIDPFHGQQDLQQRILRHVSEAFSEDPLRVLRVARFAARFPGFSIATETLELMKSIVASGELQTLTRERVWIELEKNFLENRPSRFFAVLDEIAALDLLFPELAAMKSIPQRADYHAEGDVWVHSLMVLEKAVEQANANDIQGQNRVALLAASLWHDVGKTATPQHLLYDKQGNMLGRHPGHDSPKTVLPLLDALFSRLPFPKMVMQLVRDTAMLHIRIHRITDMKPSSIARFFDENSFHNKGGEDYLQLLAMACKADLLGRLLTVEGKICEPKDDYPQLEWLLRAYKLIREVKIGEWITDYKNTHASSPSTQQIREAKRKLEIEALQGLY
jgi:tRNA nucleotidyltransferase (CCA-adding enzyme)